MVVNLRAKKRLVSRIVGVGLHRVKFDNDHLDDITDAITRVNIRSLITANTIKIKRIVGTSHGRATLKKFKEENAAPNKVLKKEEKVPV